MPLLLSYLQPAAPAPLGPTLPCMAKSAPAKSLVTCGLQKITLTESTFDAEKKPKTRVATESVSGSHATGHKPLKMDFKMTAPAEGGALPGKKIVLKREGVGGCGSAQHLKWVVDGATKDVEYSQIMFSEKSAATYLKEAMTKARANAALSIYKSGYSPAGAAFQKGSANLTTYGVEATARGLGLDLVFDAVYRSAFSRRHYSFAVASCGNPGTSTAVSALIALTVYPSEKYKIEINFPFVGKSVSSYSGSVKNVIDTYGNIREKPKGRSEEDETPSFKLTVDNADSKTSVDFTKYIYFAKQAEEVADTLKYVFKVVPKLGFWIDGSIKVLSGNISLEWQWVEDNDRGVVWAWTLEAALTLIEASIELNYGIQFMSQELKVSAKITGAFKLKSSIGSGKSVRPTKEGQTVRFPAEGSLVLDIGLTGKVSAVSCWVGVSAGVKTDMALLVYIGPEGRPDSAGQSHLGLSVGETTLDSVDARVNIKVEKVWEFNREVSLIDEKKVLFKGIS